MQAKLHITVRVQSTTTYSLHDHIHEYLHTHGGNDLMVDMYYTNYMEYSIYIYLYRNEIYTMY